MTGYGEAQDEQDDLTVSVEIRSINNKYFKLNVRATEGYASLEPQIDALVRGTIRRGTVQVTLRIQRRSTGNQYHINNQVLENYLEQLQAFSNQQQNPRPITLESLLLLPGVIDEVVASHSNAIQHWGCIEKVIAIALEDANRMRLEEGQSMAKDLISNCNRITGELDQIEQRTSNVVDDYRIRITDRVNRMLAEFEITVQPTDLIREIAMFAEKADIAEEVVRLQSHLEQFQTVMQAPESPGRKLEFLTQEMFRETNTIGSKANDSEIGRHVIEIKSAIERMREMIQNVE